MITPLPSLYYLDYGVTWHLQCIHDLDYHVMMPSTTQYMCTEDYFADQLHLLAVAAFKSTAGVFPTRQSKALLFSKSGPHDFG